LPQPPADNPIGSPFIELQSIDSTNNYARQQIHAGLAQHGTTIFAHEQTAGKGQRGKTWNSEKDVNIMMSVVIRPGPINLSHQFHLNACVAISVHEFFQQYAGEDTQIKWPNDLYWQDRKAGGTLIESVVVSRESGVPTWEWSIVGIGININQTVFSPDLPNPVSLKQITGKSFEVISLAKELLAIFNKNFTQLTGNSFENIHRYYLEHLYKKDKRGTLKKNTRVFEAVIKSVSSSGKLIVQHGIEEEFDFGEIEWVM